MPPMALHRIHSILKHAVAMRDADIDLVCSQTEAILSENMYSQLPQLAACVGADGWLPIASLLNYSPLGQTVWPFGGVGVVADCLIARGSSVIELSGDSSSVRRMPPRVQLRSAVEFIFSDNNFHKDVHLQLLQEKDGFVPLHKIVSSYAAVQQLVDSKRVSLDSIPEAIESSSELEVVKRPSSSASLVRRKTLAEKICSQVEWYLDEKRLASDRFLYETSCDHDGWIPVSTLLSFPRMRKLCYPQAAAVAHVLSASKMLEVSPDFSCVRPGRAPLSSPARAARRDPTFQFQIVPRTWTDPPALHPGADFSIMTYNCLADMLCTVEQFPSVNVGVLDWEYRRSLITREIAHHLPDLICMQELQGNAAGAGADDHYSAMRDHLAKSGYENRYMRKIKRNGVGWPHTQIGNAIFWRTSRFEYLEHEEVPIAVKLNALCEDEPSAAHFGRGAQVGLVVALKHKSSGRTLVVVTTHLSCNFQEPWTQVAQIQVVLLAAAALAAKHGPDVAIIMGADLNSIPGSGVYHLVSSGHLSASHPHLRIIAEQVEMPEFGEHAEFGGGSADLRQPMPLVSAYGSLLGQEPLFTNFTTGFIGTLDYVFANQMLEPLQVLTLPSEDDVRKEGFLPASAFPSDHLSLIAKFGFRPTDPGGAVVMPTIVASRSPSNASNSARESPAASAGATSHWPTDPAAVATVLATAGHAPRTYDPTMPPPPVPHHVCSSGGSSAESSPSKRQRGQVPSRSAPVAAPAPAAGRSHWRGEPGGSVEVSLAACPFVGGGGGFYSGSWSSQCSGSMSGGSTNGSPPMVHAMGVMGGAHQGGWGASGMMGAMGLGGGAAGGVDASAPWVVGGGDARVTPGGDPRSRAPSGSRDKGSGKGGGGKGGSGGKSKGARGRGGGFGTA
jgi:mRNA deadenylase 3'-5' endonuclease subunit Ccr4